MSSFVNRIRDEAVRAKFEATRLVRLQREQSKLSQLQAAKRDHLGNLGEIVWEMYIAGQVTDPRLIVVCQQVQAVNQEIAGQETAIEQIKQEQPPEPPKCPACGRELSANDTFCPGCGAKITPALAQPAVTPVGVANRICPNCGRSVRSSAAFCSGCGTRMPMS
jgi:wobble nucleotide-excising tRNase